MRLNASLFCVIAMLSLCLATTVTATEINVVTTFSTIDNIPDLAGATLVFDGAYDGDGTGNYVPFAPDMTSAGAAKSFTVNISGAVNPALNGTYPANTAVYYAFFETDSQAITGSAFGSPIEFTVGTETLSAYLSFDNGPLSPTAGAPLNVADFDTIPGAPASTVSFALLSLTGAGGGDDFAALGMTVMQDVQAVPEPSTWLLMILGSAAVAVCARRRQARSAA